jgi:hypothetical protein
MEILVISRQVEPKEATRCEERSDSGSENDPTCEDPGAVRKDIRWRAGIAQGGAGDVTGGASNRVLF